MNSVWFTRRETDTPYLKKSPGHARQCKRSLLTMPGLCLVWNFNLHVSFRFHFDVLSVSFQTESGNPRVYGLHKVTIFLLWCSCRPVWQLGSLNLSRRVEAMNVSRWNWWRIQWKFHCETATICQGLEMVGGQRNHSSGMLSIQCLCQNCKVLFMESMHSRKNVRIVPTVRPSHTGQWSLTVH